MKINKFATFPSNTILIIIIAILLIFGCGYDKDSVMFVNKTSSDIVIVNCYLNKKTVLDKNILVDSSAKGYVAVKNHMELIVNDFDVLEIIINDVNGNKIFSSCTIRKNNNEKCLYKVYYNGSSKLKCVCDPYEDFND